MSHAHLYARSQGRYINNPITQAIPLSPYSASMAGPVSQHGQQARFLQKSWIASPVSLYIGYNMPVAIQVPEALKDTKTLAIVAGVGTAAVAGAYLVKRSRRDPKPKTGPLTPDTLPKDAYDAVVVGAGAAAPLK